MVSPLFTFYRTADLIYKTISFTFILVISLERVMAAELESPCADMDTVRERIRLMTSPQVTTDQLVSMYNRWASNYEKVTTMIFCICLFVW